MKRNNGRRLTPADSFRKKLRRRTFKKKRKSGFCRFYFAVIKRAKSRGKLKYNVPRFEVYDPYSITETSPLHPVFSDNIQFLAKHKKLFDGSMPDIPTDGRFMVPNPFSLTTNQAKTMQFLKSLFYALHEDKLAEIMIDYEECDHIDLDASVCMDVMLREFIDYYKRCNRLIINKKIASIEPVNWQKDSVRKILFSIGSYKNIKGFEIKYQNLIPFHLIIGDNWSSNVRGDKEIEVTQMVDYIEERLSEMNHVLTWQAANKLSKVIGEALINAAEHSGRRYRYAIGYFEKQRDEEKHVGIFNLTIFSFGKTIYQTFKEVEDPESWPVIGRMKELSAKFTERNMFKSREFEEETLWTLYALQQGVTSVKDKKRGNGSIAFIESFFSLKGDMHHDNISSLAILSGHTKIKFDGTYEIEEKARGEFGRIFKMMTFNKSGNIEEKPDEEYVTFADNFFPGTLITAKICINYNNIENE